MVLHGVTGRWPCDFEKARLGEPSLYCGIRSYLPEKCWKFDARSAVEPRDLAARKGEGRLGPHSPVERALRTRERRRKVAAAGRERPLSSACQTESMSSRKLRAKAGNTHGCACKRSVGDHERQPSIGLQHASLLREHAVKISRVPQEDGATSGLRVSDEHPSEAALQLARLPATAFGPYRSPSELAELSERVAHPDKGHPVAAQVVDRAQVGRRRQR